MEHAVIAHIPLREEPFGSEREREAVADLAGELQHAINEYGVGEFDGEESGGRRCVLTCMVPMQIGYSELWSRY